MAVEAVDAARATPRGKLPHRRHPQVLQAAGRSQGDLPVAENARRTRVSVAMGGWVAWLNE